MRLLYTHPNRILVENCKNVVENAGIETMLQNEYAGGAIGELAPINAWLELWVANDSDYDKAKQLVDSTFADDKENAATWQCSKCHEMNDAAFDFCWKCQQQQPQSNG